MCDVDDEAVVVRARRPVASTTSRRCCTREGLDAYVVRRLGLPFRDVDWTDWDDLLRRVHHPAQRASTIALVGKYVDLPDAYLSVGRGAAAGGFAQRRPGQNPVGHQRRLPDARGRGRGSWPTSTAC